MASGPNPVTITIGGDAGPLKKATGEARVAVENLADSGFGKLQNALKEYRQEEVQQGRATRFFTSEFKNLLPVSESTAGAMAGLGKILGAGGVFGMGIEAAKLGLEKLVEHHRAAEAAAEEQRKKLYELGLAEFSNAAALRASGENALVAYLAPFKTAQQQFVDAFVAPTEAKIRETEAAQETALKKLGLLKGQEGKEDFKKAEEERSQAQSQLAQLRTLLIEKRAEAEANADYAVASKRENDAKREAYEAERKVAESALKVRDTLRQSPSRDLLGVKDLPLAISVGKEMEEVFRRIDFEANHVADVTIPKFTKEEKDALLFAESIENAYKSIGATLDGSFRSFAGSATNAFRPLLLQTSSYTKAMQAVGGSTKAAADLSGAAFAAMAQDALASLAVQAAQKAIFYTAEGIALTVMGNPGAAGMFASAAMMAGVAGAAGGGAAAIGQNRGMTAAERQQVNDAASRGEPGDRGGGGSFASGSSGGTTVIRETPIILAHPFMTLAEAAQYGARAIAYAERLDMLKRS